MGSTARIQLRRKCEVRCVDASVLLSIFQAIESIEQGLPKLQRLIGDRTATRLNQQRELQNSPSQRTPSAL